MLKSQIEPTAINQKQLRKNLINLQKKLHSELTQLLLVVWPKVQNLIPAQDSRIIAMAQTLKDETESCLAVIDQLIADVDKVDPSPQSTADVSFELQAIQGGYDKQSRLVPHLFSASICLDKMIQNRMPNHQAQSKPLNIAVELKELGSKISNVKKYKIPLRTPIPNRMALLVYDINSLEKQITRFQNKYTFDYRNASLKDTEYREMLDELNNACFQLMDEVDIVKASIGNAPLLFLEYDFWASAERLDRLQRGEIACIRHALLVRRPEHLNRRAWLDTLGSFQVPLTRLSKHLVLMPLEFRARLLNEPNFKFGDYYREQNSLSSVVQHLDKGLKALNHELNDEFDDVNALLKSMDPFLEKIDSEREKFKTLYKVISQIKDKDLAAILILYRKDLKVKLDVFLSEIDDLMNKIHLERAKLDWAKSEKPKPMLWIEMMAGFKQRKEILETCFGPISVEIANQLQQADFILNSQQQVLITSQVVAPGISSSDVVPVVAAHSAATPIQESTPTTAEILFFVVATMTVVYPLAMLIISFFAWMLPPPMTEEATVPRQDKAENREVAEAVLNQKFVSNTPSYLDVLTQKYYTPYDYLSGSSLVKLSAVPRLS